MSNTTDHNSKVVEFIVGSVAEFSGDIDALFEKVRGKFPALSEDDVMKCFEEAAEQLERKMEREKRELGSLQSLKPLFEGMPKGMTLGECARIKAEKGDALAISYLAWERNQAGGSQ